MYAFVIRFLLHGHDISTWDAAVKASPVKIVIASWTLQQIAADSIRQRPSGVVAGMHSSLLWPCCHGSMLILHGHKQHMLWRLQHCYVMATMYDSVMRKHILHFCPRNLEENGNTAAGKLESPGPGVHQFRPQELVQYKC